MAEIDLGTVTIEKARNMTGSVNAVPGEAGGAGATGKDGVSATHSWNGTVLTITSASGTSSADLKGPKGDTGATGPEGPAGPTGATGPAGPVYELTEADKQEIVEDVLAEMPEIPSGGSGGAEKQWRLINTVEITEAVKAIDIEIDSNGNEFEITDFLIYAPLNVTVSADSQLLIYGYSPGTVPNSLGTMPFEGISSSTNGFLKANQTRSVVIRSEWNGVRYTEGASTTYDFKNVASGLSFVKLADLYKIAALRIESQGSTTFNTGTFYIYGR